MAQTLLAAASAASPPLSDDRQTFASKGNGDLSGSRLAQLISLAEAESQRRVVPKPSQDDELLAPVLAPLASHHHQSEYNRSKFGADPTRICRYVPLSIQLPSHVKLLREKQANVIMSRVFYSASRSRSRSDSHPTMSSSRRLESSLVSVDRTPCSPKQESPPLPHQSPPPEATPSSGVLDHPNTTSHLPQVSTQSLDPAHSRQLDPSHTKSPSVPPQGPSSGSKPVSEAQPDLSMPKTSLTHPINVATLIPTELLPRIFAKLTASPSAKPTLYTPPHGETLLSYLPNPSTAQPTMRTTITVTTLRQRPSASKQSPPTSSVASMMQTSTGFFQQALNAVIPNALRTNTFGFPLPSSESRPSRASITLPSGASASAASTGAHKRNMSTSTTTRGLGNLLISSCPGKKVRLNGEHKEGRQAICRDLSVDLARMKSLGVRCIVCCLDDEELEFLGVPWHLYLQSAMALGLDVLRIPMPEGLGPLGAAYLDEQIGNVIRNYTLCGVNVLTHCRGGVGRAGLFACCWSIKLGLCGPIAKGNSPPSGYVRRDALEIVDNAIRCIRLRRSLKAIETYEQVKFLIEFVEHLRSSASKTK